MLIDRGEEERLAWITSWDHVITGSHYLTQFYKCSKILITSLTLNTQIKPCVQLSLDLAGEYGFSSSYATGMINNHLLYCFHHSLTSSFRPCNT